MAGMFDDIVPTQPRTDLPVLCDVRDCHCGGLGHAWRVTP